MGQFLHINNESYAPDQDGDGVLILIQQWCILLAQPRTQSYILPQLRRDSRGGAVPLPISLRFRTKLKSHLTLSEFTIG